MKKLISNIGLILALSVVVIMVIGIFLYDYIPTGIAVSKVKVYESDEETTKVLSSIAKESQALSFSNTTDESSEKSNLVLQTYSITKSDLDVYQSADIYERGKVDPFKRIEEPDENTSNISSTNGITNTSISSNNSSSQNTESNSNDSNSNNVINSNNIDNLNNSNYTQNGTNSTNTVTSESNTTTSNNSNDLKPNVSDGTLFNSTTTK